MKPLCFKSIKKWWYFNAYYIFNKGNQNESKKYKLLENRFPFTKTHFQDSLFKINCPEFLFRENDRRTFDFIIKVKKLKKDISSDHLVRLTPNYFSMNCRYELWIVSMIYHLHKLISNSGSLYEKYEIISNNITYNMFE